MEQWVTVSLVLCTFGLLRELRPSEPYVSEFLVGPWRNITKETLYQEVYPISTYSYLGLLVVIFLITDYLKYKLLIIVSGLSGIAVYAILLWTESLEWLQVSQFCYALYMATEVAYYTYMFAKVDKDKYNQVASYTRSSALFGRFISGASAQLLVSFDVLDYRELNYITFTTQILATIWALFLPPVKKSIYFHREAEIPMTSDDAHADNFTQENVIHLFWKHIKSAYTQNTVVCWSIWYAASTAGYYQVQSYIQILWIEVELGDKNIYNGIVKAIITILSSGAALLAGLRRFKNQNIYNILPAIAAAFQSIVILIASYAEALWLCYLGYICLSITYHYMITIASFHIAKGLKYNNCFGLIFGLNTLFALTIQSLMTLLFVSVHGFNFTIRNQYKAYASYFATMSVIGFVLFVSTYFVKRKRTENENLEELATNENENK
ncbi:thiamine transporter 1-like [Arctopsyche grandis]|uniref:thiamine transporter 1-like n=1 Tax=Arctopsyche grandis TaxID=121162 RepID=UPI00406D9085